MLFLKKQHSGIDYPLCQPKGQEHMVSTKQTDPPLWRRALAYWWYVWGLSVCYSGNRALDRSFYVAGVRSFGRATRLWPGYARAYYWRGLIRGRELGEYEQALVDLGSAIALAPEWAEPYLQRGLFRRFHGGDTAAAITDLESYLRLSDNTYWRGEAQRQIDQIYAQIQNDGDPSDGNAAASDLNR